MEIAETIGLILGNQFTQPGRTQLGRQIWAVSDYVCRDGVIPCDHGSPPEQCGRKEVDHTVGKNGEESFATVVRCNLADEK